MSKGENFTSFSMKGYKVSVLSEEKQDNQRQDN